MLTNSYPFGRGSRGRGIELDAREVRTKTRKSFISDFFPVGDDVEQIVVDWIAELQFDQLFGPDDPLFPSTAIELNDEGHFAPTGLSRKNWSNAGPIHKIFRAAFENAGLPYFNPHSLRKTLVSFGQSRCRTPEHLKVWSQNLGHEDVLTTLRSYGTVSRERQAEIMASLRHAENANPPRLDLRLAKCLRDCYVLNTRSAFNLTIEALLSQARLSA